MMMADYVSKVFKYNEKRKKEHIFDHNPKSEAIQVTNISRPLQNKEDEDIYVGSHLAYTNIGHLEMIQSMSEPDDVHYMKDIIKSHFSDSMLHIIEEIKVNKTQAEHNYFSSINDPNSFTDQDIEEIKEEYEKWVFNTRLGSHIKNPKAAAEFMKYVCEVFKLEEACEGAVNTMKRS